MTWKAAAPTNLHCTDCSALPDEPCRQSDGKSVAPHPARQAAYEANHKED